MQPERQRQKHAVTHSSCGAFRFTESRMGHRSQQSPVTLKYRDSHNGSHSPLTFFRKSRFADVDVPFFIIRPLRLS